METREDHEMETQTTELNELSMPAVVQVRIGNQTLTKAVQITDPRQLAQAVRAIVPPGDEPDEIYVSRPEQYRNRRCDVRIAGDEFHG